MNDLIKRTDMKLIPIKNPNYPVKESAQELIEILQRGLVYVLDDEDTVIGFIDLVDGFYEQDEFICGSILFNMNEAFVDGYEWCNAEVMIDKDNNIKSIKSVVYKEKTYD